MSYMMRRSLVPAASQRQIRCRPQPTAAIQLRRPLGTEGTGGRRRWTTEPTTAPQPMKISPLARLGLPKCAKTDVNTDVVAWVALNG